MTKRHFLIGATLILSTVQVMAYSLYEGDVKYACEAILCLSSGERPHECDPALKRYFDIDYEDPRETAKERKEFLELCPDQEAEETEAFIAQAKKEGGLVEEEEDKKKIPPYGCPADFVNELAQIKNELGVVISDERPLSCALYSEGKEPPVYIGEMGWGGFWAERSNEEQAWERYRHYVPNWARKRELLGVTPIWPPGWE